MDELTQALARWLDAAHALSLDPRHGLRVVEAAARNLAPYVAASRVGPAVVLGAEDARAVNTRR